MNVRVKIKSEQIFEDRKESEEHVAKGNIEYLKNGTVLKFVEKIEQQELNFKMTILENKIIIDRQGNIMQLDYEKDDNCRLDTPYGSMNMLVHTEEIKYKYTDNLIQSIILKYKITLENNMQYDNVVTIGLDY